MSRALTSIASCVTVPRTAAQDAAQDLRVALTLAADGHTWREIARAAIQFLQHDACVSVVYRQHFSKALDVVPSAATPRHVSKIGVVVYSVVDKRCQPMLVDCVPKPKLGSDTVTEP
jgi:hypothetical protein